MNLSSNASISSFSLFSTHALVNEGTDKLIQLLLSTIHQFQAPLTFAPAMKGEERLSLTVVSRRSRQTFTPYLPIPQQFAAARVKSYHAQSSLACSQGLRPLQHPKRRKLKQNELVNCYLSRSVPRRPRPLYLTSVFLAMINLSQHRELTP